MNRIDQTFVRLKKEGRKALIGYLTAGFPNKESLSRLVPLLEAAGLDILELGIPFSDPIADGPTIQRSSQVALEKGSTLPWVLDEVATLRSLVRLPLVFMSYCNPILAMGAEKFFKRARQSGVDGLIVPDLIPEESKLFDAAAQKEGIHLIYMVAPTNDRARIQFIASKTRGFLYAVSLTGVTGARTALSHELPQFLKTTRQVSNVPLAVGFGLSTPAQVKEVAQHADGVIVGSALIKQVEKSENSGYQDAAGFVRSLRQSLDQLTSPPRKDGAYAA
jgi:tryptophan synthase alpha chain